MLVEYPLQIIIVDDDEDMLKLISTYLKGVKDIETYSFTSPVEALHYIKDNPANIVVSDINMDEMYGDELLRKIREMNKGIQVIMLTAVQNLITFQSCRKGGAFSLLMKPIKKKDIVDAIKNIDEDFKNWNEQYSQLIARKKQER